MQTNEFSKELKTFYVIGLNYKKADARVRGLFSIPEAKKMALLIEAKEMQIPSLAVLSTCNRTELYGVANHPYELIRLLCKYTKGTVEEFEKIAYIYKEQEAVTHLFKVGTGLDSQIIGDFEIISQVRNAFKQSKEENMLNTYMERLVNAVIQASKRIKNETELSSGATSVSFAAVQYIMEKVNHISNKNILLFGTGSIGANTVENLVKHSHNEAISLINRTKINAEALGKKYKLVVKDYQNLPQEIADADILIVATGAQHPTITQNELKLLYKPLLILDLSIPQNVAENVANLDNVKRVHLDQLSVITEATQEKRNAEVPKALHIIEEVKNDFFDWVNVRKFAPFIRALKDKFNQIKEEEIDFQSKKEINFNLDQAEVLGDRIVQKIITQFASHLRSGDAPLHTSIDIISDIFHLELNSVEN